MVSVIIPVKNGEATLEKCLAAVKNQTIADGIEIIVLDSASSDNSAMIAKSFGAEVIEINPDEFNHGSTRNVGVKFATRELLYFTVQDAYVSEADQLQKMANHFKDISLQAVVGMQAIPHDKDKNPARWFKRFTKPETVFRHFPEGDFGQMPLKEQFKHCGWDNVNAMYRKSALETIPFAKTNFAEDWLWVRDALAAKMKIAFDPSLVVYHYHHRDFSYSFKVQYILNYNFYKFFNVYPGIPAFIKPVLTDIYLVWKNRQINIKDKLYWSVHNLLGRSAVVLSHLTFLVFVKLLGNNALDRSLYYFCHIIPQGKIKSSY